MQPITDELDPYLQKQVSAGVEPLDIMHGHLKLLMLEAEQRFDTAAQEESDSGEAIASMERRYWEGILDAYEELYKVTYLLSFAIADRD